MTQQPINPDVTSDDKLWTLLAYILSPLIPIVLMLMEDKKNRPFIKYHNVQALILGIIEVVLYIVIGWTLFGLCVPVLLWFYMIYLGIKAYQGEYVVVPVITDWAKKQGWA
jgi:uncharacterized membrane protein